MSHHRNAKLGLAGGEELKVHAGAIRIRVRTRRCSSISDQATQVVVDLQVLQAL